MQPYSFQNIVVLVNGVELTGWADGDDVISIKRRSDSITDKVGASGSMMVSVSADKSGEFTFKLQQTSRSNNYLNTLMELQEAGGIAFVPVSIQAQDMLRNDLASGTAGYIKKPADMNRGAQGGNQEWIVVVERLDLVFGNNIPLVAGLASAH